MADKLLTPEEVSELLQVPIGVLAQWRCRGQAPRFLKIGGKHVRYSLAELERFLQDATMVSTRRKAPDTDEGTGKDQNAASGPLGPARRSVARRAT